MDAGRPEPRLHHVGIVVPDDGQLRQLLTLLDLRIVRTQYVPQYEADCVFTGGAKGPIEFIVPRGGKLAAFNHGAGGLHHIALEVPDVEAAAVRLRAQDVELLEPQPVDAGPLRINFLPPAHTRGVIVEIVESRATVLVGED